MPVSSVRARSCSATTTAPPRHSCGRAHRPSSHRSGRSTTRSPSRSRSSSTSGPWLIAEYGCELAYSTPVHTDLQLEARRVFIQSVEATTGFEPVNRGFADLRVEPLHHVATGSGHCRRVAAPRGFEPRFTDPKSAVLPLDEGAAARTSRDSRAFPGQNNGAEDGTRTRDPHLGKVMLYQLSHFRSMYATTPMVVPRARIELATPRFSVACSTN